MKYGHGENEGNEMFFTTSLYDAIRAGNEYEAEYFSVILLDNAPQK